MRKLAVLTMTLLMAGGLAFAQQPPRQGQGQGGRQMPTAAERAEQLKKEYKLDEKQTADLTALFTKQNEQFAKLRESQNDREKMREAMQTIRQENEKELQTILGEENYKKYSAQQAERMRQFGGGGNREGRTPQR